ncbi:RnfABCDGE type electron transport complex subunit B [Sedimenticola hydrogenitrophicus]|uniref:RnfABCDGE type electron transport complex subunit B n=1 Tax=Sedimenticola hydrogenitrophicus TaxID=2967975 RepID=UPI0021A94FD3|nr:RnfABCDGE type electron transport complex subunit B [Sedimenticola hydrogenitrophicus]
MTDITSIALSVGFMAVLGSILASILVLANKRLFVYEDPRIDDVEDLLPRANCGACGSPGCRPFAEGLIDGTYEPAQCTVNAKETNELIASYLGVDLGAQEKRVARLACAGGSHVAFIRASYAGMSSCRAAALVSGGGKGCSWGCLGMGDCAVVCDFDAISMNKYGLPVVDEERCTACNDCVEVCPKDLFELHSVNEQLFVACKNLEKGEEAESQCEVICTACERCAVDSPEGLIDIRNNLAVVNYRKNDLASRVAIERCPTGAIVWFDKQGGYQVGKDAKKIIRKEMLPIG